MRLPRWLPGAFLPAALALALGSCSSAPPRSDTVTSTKDNAADAEISGERYFRQGRYDLALQFFTQALDANASVDNVDGVIRCRIAIAQVYLATDRRDAADDMFTRAREQARGRNPALFIDSSLGLGELALRKGEPHRALAVLQEARDDPGAKPTPEQTAALYHDIGAAWKSAGEMAKALDWLSRSLESNLAHKQLEQAAADYYMIASVHSKQGDFEAAEKNAHLALELDKKEENSVGISQDLYALGLIASKKGDPASAYDYFQRAYGVSATLADKRQMRECLTRLITLADSLGRSDEAQGYRQALDRLGSP